MTDPEHCRWCGRTQPCRHCTDPDAVPPEIATYRARMADPRMHWVRDLLARVEAVHDGRPRMRTDEGDVQEFEWKTIADMIVRELDTPRSWRAHFGNEVGVAAEALAALRADPLTCDPGPQYAEKVDALLRSLGLTN